MRSSLLFATAFIAAGASAKANWASDRAVAEMERTYNCECHCDCDDGPAPGKRCEVDYLILLDAASCVRDAWMEMLNRVRNVAKTIDDSGRSIGGETRFGVMRYAEEVSYDIKFEENLDYRDFSRRLSRLETYNAGSYLKRGWAQMAQIVSEHKRSSNRRLIVIVVTNGISHPGKEGSPTTQEIRSVQQQLMGPRGSEDYGLFVNTIIKIPDNIMQQAADCFACKWNDDMFRDGGLVIEHQVFSKSRLEDRLLAQVSNKVCVHKASPSEVCNNCECTCDVPAGPPGLPGPQGVPGVPGTYGTPGVNGEPGTDGACGMPGPDGGPGCDGAHGNPGSHGRPGAEGSIGAAGNRGSQGPEGPAGHAARLAEGAKGPRGEEGVQGPAGSKGANGRSGQPGSDGPAGQSGPMGHPGKHGEAGNDGLDGRPGNDGEPGEPGYDGSDGPNGANGERGQRGANGERGDAGPNGPQGREGPAGAPGLCGEPGDKGVSGMMGACGAPGRMGGAVSDTYVRSQVRAMLDRLLPQQRDARFCNCKAYSLYNVISKNINI